MFSRKFRQFDPVRELEKVIANHSGNFANWIFRRSDRTCGSSGFKPTRVRACSKQETATSEQSSTVAQAPQMTGLLLHIWELAKDSFLDCKKCNWCCSSLLQQGFTRQESFAREEFKFPPLTAELEPRRLVIESERRL